jgi:hypothetical protein
MDQANQANSQSNSFMCVLQSRRGTILCPAWNPLVIVLDTNGEDTTPFLFRNPFVLMRAVQSMSDTEIRQLLIENANNLHKSREQGQSEEPPVYFGVALGPQADIRASMLQISRALQINQRSIPTPADAKMAVEWIHRDDVVNLCEVLRAHGSNVQQPYEAKDAAEYFSIFNITQTIPWMRLVSQLEKTNSVGIRDTCSCQ